MDKKGGNMSRRNSKNISRNTKSRKRRKINPIKIATLIIVLGFIIFGVIKVSKGVYTFLSSIGGSSITEDDVNTDKQFDLNDEKSTYKKKFTVLVDPGHGGKDIGTESSRNVKDGKNNIYEKDIALQIAKKVTSKLSRYNDIDVIISRTDDTFISILDRMEIANSQHVDVSVSIHLNAEAGGNTAEGVETYYKKGATDGSQELAEIVQASIISHVEARDRGARAENYDMVKGVTTPAILVETGFLTNPKEEKKLRDSKYQEQMAEGIVQGILSYLDTTSKQ